MKLNSLNLKLIVGTVYISIISIGLYFLFSAIDIKDLMSYEFIRVNKDIILKYKNENFLLLTSIFFYFFNCVGFAFRFCDASFNIFWLCIWKMVGNNDCFNRNYNWSCVIIYIGRFFFREIIKNKLAPKFSRLKEFFIKNDILYFTSFRFIGGGGAPYAVQNVLPILFDMSLKIM